MHQPTKTSPTASPRRTASGTPAPESRKVGSRALPLEGRSRRVHSAGPHLYRNRHGTYYFRIKFSGNEFKRSLGTKDRNMATVLAAQINFRLAMQPKNESDLIAEILAKAEQQRRFDMVLPNGMRLNNIDSATEVDNVLKLINGMDIERIGMIEPEHRPLRPTAASRVAAATPLFLDAVEPYLTQKGHDTENRSKTLLDKRAT